MSPFKKNIIFMQYLKTEMGYKYSLTNISAAFGLWQLKYIGYVQREIDISNSKELYKNVIFLPLYQGTSDSRLNYIIQKMNNLWFLF